MKKIEIEAKETYVASVVHDLKNPLIAQSRILEGLIKKTSYEDLKLLDMYKQMLGSSKIMFEMVSSILNTYKYSTGDIAYNFQEFDFVDLIYEISKELTSFTNEEKDLILNINAKPSMILADKMHLRRVVSNLLSNALRYKKEDTPVYIELKSDEKNYRFTVTNRGYYITPEIQSEIFNKYVSPSSKFNSFATGLGLYLSKQIILGHNGKMLVSSTKDGINTFGFVIPRKQRQFIC